MRIQKFLGSETYVMERSATGALAEVRIIDDLHRGTEPHPYAPEEVEMNGRWWVRPTVVSSEGAIELAPKRDEVELQLWMRHRGALSTNFLPVHSLSGALHLQLPTTIRPLPRFVRGPLRLPLPDLHNVYNGAPLGDGDLLLIELSEGSTVERYLFRTRQIGWRTDAGLGVLVQVPLPGGSTNSFSPVFAVSLAVGYRFPDGRPTLRWIGDNLTLVGSLGVGSTAVESGEVGVEQLDSLLNAALLGGGIELYGFLSVQLFSNVSAPFRNAAEEPLTLAIGFDAVQFGLATRNALTRLFRKNELQGY